GGQPVWKGGWGCEPLATSEWLECGCRRKTVTLWRASPMRKQETRDRTVSQRWSTTILNRVASGRFQNNIQAVIDARDQFEPVTKAGGWRNLPPLALVEEHARR